MTKILVLAEKPSVARDIARVLDCPKKGNGFLEGNKYIVTWALGHLVGLADPEMYDVKYKTWDINDLPMLPDKMKLVVLKGGGKQFGAVKTLLHRSDVKNIVIATDSGREGELVARWIIKQAKVKKPMQRLWISSVTDKAIRDGFKNLRPSKDYDNLYQSAVARAEADWLVGINATRALTCKHNAQLSCGRVQTPTVAMIAQREEERRSFQPQTYYGIQMMLADIPFNWSEGTDFNEEKVESTIKSLRGKEAKVVSVETKAKKTYAPALYDLTELQRDGNKMFGFSAKETLNIMQKLYEQHKVVTYPRTDSRYLTTDMVGTLAERVKAVNIRPYNKIASKLIAQGIKGNKSFVDNSKVSDHHAIVPTEETAILSALSDKERKIYDLIVKRFLAVLSRPSEYNQTVITASIGKEQFIAKENVVTVVGWKEIYDDEIEIASFPILKQGQTLSVQQINKTSGKTTPPALFNEATLLSAMENPTAYMRAESKELVKAVSTTGGLGTVATRADVIEKLFNSFLIEKRGKEISVTQKGKQLLQLAPADLCSPALTGEWELKLGRIAKGSLKKEAFIDEMKGYTKSIIREIKSSTDKFKHDNVTGKKCPECGKFLLEVNGKKGKMLVCQDRECGYRKNISKTTNARCPQCHKKLELRGEGEGQIFACKCGYREKLSTFKARKEKEGKGRVSKQDVSKYLKKQNKQDDEPFNNPFAEALAKLKK